MNAMRTCMLVLICCLFISCESELNLPTSQVDIIELAYDNTYEYPDGFFYEMNLVGSLYYENTISVVAPADRGNIWIDLDTNDRDQARSWSQLSDQYGSVPREVIEDNETEKYFEIVRQNPLFSNDIIRSRTHRSDYFVSLHDRFSSLDTIGIYNGPQNAIKVKEFVEYLWSSRIINTWDKVLESEITETSTNFQHYIKSFHVVFGDFGVQDVIYVYDNHFVLDKSNKILVIERRLVEEIIVD